MFERIRRYKTEIERTIVVWTIAAILAACTASPSASSSAYDAIIACIDTNSSRTCDRGDLPVSGLEVGFLQKDNSTITLSTDENGEILQVPEGTTGLTVEYKKQVEEKDLFFIGQYIKGGAMYYLFDFEINMHKVIG